MSMKGTVMWEVYMHSAVTVLVVTMQCSSPTLANWCHKLTH